MKKIILIILILGCYNENLLLPKTSIIEGPENGEIIRDNIIKIKWKGNGCTYYQYSIDGKISNWTKEESLFLILDDGWHNFWIRGKNILGDKEKDYPDLFFCVDGINNGFAVYPIFDSLPLSEEIKIILKGEKLKRHSFEFIKFVWDNGITLLEYKIDSSIFSSNSTPVIIVKEFSCSLEIYRTNFEEFPEQDIIIGNFEFISSIKGIFNFKIKEARIFDSLGVEIPYDTINGGRIVVY